MMEIYVKFGLVIHPLVFAHIHHAIVPQETHVLPLKPVSQQQEIAHQLQKIAMMEIHVPMMDALFPQMDVIIYLGILVDVTIQTIAQMIR